MGLVDLQQLEGHRLDTHDLWCIAWMEEICINRVVNLALQKKKILNNSSNPVNGSK